MMSKGKLYTLLTFIISFCVVIGGWFLTERLLNQREQEFLNSTGQIALQQSESALFENVMAEGMPDGSEFHGETLSETMMEMILAVWESGGYKQPCEPGEGQMNMEQAIMEGRGWIANLAKKGILPGYLEECSFDKTDAVCYTLDVEVLFEEALLNFWEIAYTEGDVKVTLTIHAVSGQVWKADILMDADKMIYEVYSEEELLEIAFPFMMSNETGTIQDNPTIYKSFPEGKVFAALKRSTIKITDEQVRDRLVVWLCSGQEKNR